MFERSRSSKKAYKMHLLPRHKFSYVCSVDERSTIRHPRPSFSRLPSVSCCVPPPTTITAIHFEQQWRNFCAVQKNVYYISSIPFHYKDKTSICSMFKCRSIHPNTETDAYVSTLNSECMDKYKKVVSHSRDVGIRI